MKLIILYRDNSDHSRDVTDFVEMMSRKYPDKPVELMDVETKEGAQKAEVHGVVKYPAVLLLTYEGRVQGQWEGLPLPLIDDVAGQLINVESPSV